MNRHWFINMIINLLSHLALSQTIFSLPSVVSSYFTSKVFRYTKMTHQNSRLDKLHRIITSISPKKWENFSLDIDNLDDDNMRLFAEFFTGKLTNKDTGEVTHIIVKVVPSNGLNISYESVYRNEICFYSRIFPAFNAFQRSKQVKQLFDSVPNYLGGHLEGNKEFILMENIRTAGYVSMSRSTMYIDRSYMRSIFKVYGRFHALSFVYKHENPEEFRNMTAELVDIMKCLYIKGIGQNTKYAYLAAIAAFDEKLEREIVERLKSVKDVNDIFPTARDYDGDYACLTHGNCLIGNMFFKFKVRNLRYVIKDAEISCVRERVG